MPDSYLIEIRLFGKAKYETRELILSTSRRFNINISRPVPHITLVGGFGARNESKVIRDFESISRKYGLVEYIIEGIDTFPDTGVVYLDVQASQELEAYRRELRDKLKGYCSLCQFDFKEPFGFHSTIAMHLTRREAERIKDMITHDKRYHHRMLRATLVKNGKILAEYDFCLQRMLNRREALSRQILSKTFEKCIGEQKPQVTQDTQIHSKAQQIFFISDLHLGHANIIKYCNRPFRNVREMNQTLVDNWNSVIRKDDVVYFLGDLTYGRDSDTDSWLRKLNGQITFIRGNHDYSSNSKMYDSLIVEFNGIKFYLTHDPANVPRSWGGWVIHGHVHNNSRNYDIHWKYPYINHYKKTINTSVELTDYKPINLNTILMLIGINEIENVPEDKIYEPTETKHENLPQKHNNDNILVRICKFIISKFSQ